MGAAAPAAAPASRGLVCSGCGAPITPGKKFCGKCGTPVAGAQPAQPEEKSTEMVQRAGFIHWNILPGQLAVKIDEKDIMGYKDCKGFVVQDGTKAVFFADGVFAGELAGGRYPFKDMGIQQDGAVKAFFKKIAGFFTGKGYSLIDNAASIVIVLIRDTSFPLIFAEKDMPTAGVRSEVAVHALAKISNIIQFYKGMLLDSSFVSFEKVASSLAREGVTNALDAMNYFKKISKKETAKKEKKVIDNSNKTLNI